ncbi:MAG: hypothetical protein JXA54_15790 [Candidatus Heimdallarchaeota archaeon]|nr:hypothetical protein [Candidatus Heimdallarchaeota archaeon]
MCYSGYIKDRNNPNVVGATVKLYNSGDTLLGSVASSSSGFYIIEVNYLTNGYLKVEKNRMGYTNKNSFRKWN